MATEKTPVEAALEKCKKFDEKYSKKDEKGKVGCPYIGLAGENLAKNPDTFPAIVNNPMVENFLSMYTNENDAGECYETGFDHFSRQLSKDLITVENIQKAICLIYLTKMVNDKSKEDSTKGIHNDFQGQHFGNVFNTPKELNDAFIAQLNLIKNSGKIVDIDKIDNMSKDITQLTDQEKAKMLNDLVARFPIPAAKGPTLDERIKRAKRECVKLDKKYKSGHNIENVNENDGGEGIATLLQENNKTDKGKAQFPDIVEDHMFLGFLEKYPGNYKSPSSLDAPAKDPLKERALWDFLWVISPELRTLENVQKFICLVDLAREGSPTGVSRPELFSQALDFEDSDSPFSKFWDNKNKNGVGCNDQTALDEAFQAQLDAIKANKDGKYPNSKIDSKIKMDNVADLVAHYRATNIFPKSPPPPPSPPSEKAILVAPASATDKKVWWTEVQKNLTGAGLKLKVSENESDKTKTIYNCKELQIEDSDVFIDRRTNAGYIPRDKINEGNNIEILAKTMLAIHGDKTPLSVDAPTQKDANAFAKAYKEAYEAEHGVSMPKDLLKIKTPVEEKEEEKKEEKKVPRKVKDPDGEPNNTPKFIKK